MPIPVAARSMAWAYCHLPAGIAGSNPAVGRDICLLRVLCVLKVEVSETGRSLVQRKSYRLCVCVCVCVCVRSRNLNVGPLGLSIHGKKNLEAGSKTMNSGNMQYSVELGRENCSVVVLYLF